MAMCIIFVDQCVLFHFELPLIFYKYPLSLDQLNRDKKNAMAVLLDNFNNIRKHIDNSAIRGELVQLRALTSEESNTLLESATVSDANERLIYIIQKGGVNGFKQFMTALQNTSEEYQGHRDLLDNLKTDLKLVQSHSHSARHILGSLPPHDKVRSHSMTNFSRVSQAEIPLIFL